MKRSYWKLAGTMDDTCGKKKTIRGSFWGAPGEKKGDMSFLS
jgi:hypothetical protein